MANPWLKKNPFMSVWLSGANRVAGSVRGQVASEAKRQAALAAQQTTTDLVKFWSDAVRATVAPAPVKRKRRRP